MEDFIKRNRTGILVSAGVLLALGGFAYLYKRQIKSIKIDNDGYTIDSMFTDNVPLYQEEAIKRKKIISNVKYDLILALMKGETFEGSITIYFELTNNEYDEKNLFIDYQGLGVKDLKINGHYIDWNDSFRGQRVHLKKWYLSKENQNTVSMNFKSKYKRDGCGVHYFSDPLDGNDYVYSQFEMFRAHTAFPWFDQPDIRASMNLRISVPKEWIAVSNEVEKEISMYKDSKEFLCDGLNLSFLNKYIDGFIMYTFNQTPSISTYLYVFWAGWYEYIENEGKILGRDDPIRMRIYYRKSLRNDLERIKEFMHKPIILGINWYSQFFGYNFPFEKYDHVFWPEFRNDAMEHPGWVTFDEKYFHRGENITEENIICLVNLALHELCHQWFGNLVTIAWWNDLWLKEAFATFVSYLWMNHDQDLCSQFKNSWVHMNNEYKFWGYEEDEWWGKNKQYIDSIIYHIETNHPIWKETHSTDSAEDLVNGITYGKGWGFLKQLYHLIGHKSFSQATQIYFERYQWRDAKLKDFLQWLDDSNSGN